MKVLVCCVGMALAAAAPVAAEEAPSSRAEHPALALPAPAIVLTRDDLDASGLSTVGDLLERLPAEIGAVFPPDDGGDRTARIDLHGMGAQRTLILINGRPVAPDASGVPDVGLVPLVAIDRVEIYHAGAAAFAPSAIGGAVNLVTRSDLDGTGLVVQGGTAPHSPSLVYDTGLAISYHPARGRFHLFVAGGVQGQDPVSIGDRATPAMGAAPPVASLQAGAMRASVYGAASYQPRPWIAGFLEAGYQHRSTELDREPASLPPGGITISRDNLYNPTGADVIDTNRHTGLFGPRSASGDADTVRAVTGVRGTVPDDAQVFHGWSWEIAYDLGLAYGTSRRSGELALDRLAAAVGPSYLSPAGGPGCGTAQAPIAGCVPLNLFGGAADPRAIAYVTSSGTASGWSAQHRAAATAGGVVTELLDGDLSAGASADVRELRGRIAAPPGATAAAPTATGSYTLIEGLGQLSLVPVRGRPGVDRLELDASVLGYRSGASGSGATWTAGGLWRPVDGITLRGGYATAFRAPSLTELFEPRSTTPLADPAGTGPKATASGGNPDLAPETAGIVTAGAVLDPLAFQGVSLTVDYWRVALDHAIAPGSVADILRSCFVDALPSACARIHRDPARGNAIDSVDVSRTNAGSLASAGVDLAAGYDRDLAGLGRVHALLAATYLRTYRTDSAQAATRSADLSRPYPRITARFTSMWSHPLGVSAGVNLAYAGGFEECGTAVCGPGQAPTEIDAWYQLDVHAGYAFHTPAGTTTVAAGINNLLDRSPPLLTLPDGSGLRSTYDVAGRLFYARLTHRF